MGEVEDPGIELGTLYLENKKGLCISRRSRPDAKPQKHHLRAPLRYIIPTYTYGLPTNQYICTSKFFFNTHLLTTYLPPISTNNQRYIYYLPQIKFRPNRSNPVPTWYIV